MSVTTQPRSARAAGRVWGNRPRLVIDIILTISFLALMSTTLTGQFLHEWWGTLLILIVIVHLLAQWDWAGSLTRGFLARLAPRVRVNYLLNWLLFIAAVLVLVSGLAISQIVLPTVHLSVVGRNSSIYGFWHQMHTLSASIVLVLAAVHLGMNWRWVLSAVQQITGRRRVTPTPRET
jgi:Domain of unknown function (DUF4405)